MKFLVLGATGMAGHTISIYLLENGHDVDTLSRKNFPYGKNINLDIYSLELLKEIILGNAYDAIINCIGSLNQYAENDKANAVFLNSYLPHFLAKNTQNINSKIIHISTDCVFSGKKGKYIESDFADGISFYDRSKSLGELNDNKNLTFRNSIIGPDIDKNGIGLFNWFMQQNNTINGYTKTIWSGITTLTLAKAIEKAVQFDLRGLYQLTNNQIICKYDLLKLFNKYCKNDKLDINPVDGLNIDKSLINTRDDFDFVVPSYEEMIIDMKKWIFKHKDLYPHYFN